MKNQKNDSQKIRKITKNTLQKIKHSTHKNNQTTKSFSCHWHYQNIKSSTKHALEFSNHHNTNQPKPQTKEESAASGSE
ncbi:hypothetical protein HMPREF3214_00374 [Alloscardovia omnicolens]|nr:hypothetical protein HMPREF3214_00374 [Alloscardovia omnicolens]